MPDPSLTDGERLGSAAGRCPGEGITTEPSGQHRPSQRRAAGPVCV